MAIDKFKRVDITLDKANKYILDDQLAKVGDIKGRDLVVQITNAGVVQNQPDISLTFSWHNKNVGNSGMIDFVTVDRTQGIFKVTFPEAMNNTGTVLATIGVNEDDNWTFTPNFVIKVESNAYSASIPLESDDWATLLVALNKVNHISELTEEQLNIYLEKSKEAWEQFVEANKDIISAIDPGGVLLDEIVKARNDGETTYASLAKRLNDPIAIDDNLLIDGPIHASDKSALDTLKIGVNRDLFNFVFFTDPHVDSFYSEPSRINNYSLQHLSNALYLDEAVDAIVSGGDNIDGWSDSLDGQLNLHQQYATKLLFGSLNRSDKFSLKGNHDDCSGRLLEYKHGRKPYLTEPPKSITNQQIADIYQNKQLLFGEKRNGDSNYFYKDYANKKIRLIGLDSNDTPEDVLNADGSPTYFGIWHMGYRQEQLKWLANAALQNVPEDYTVVITSHMQAQIDPNPGDPESTHDNQDCLNNIINAFIKGEAKHITSTVPNWEVDFNADYTSQGPRMFAGYVHGHLHKEMATTETGFNSISITCSIGATDAFNVVTIDTDNRKMLLKGFGRATNREFNY